MSFGFAFITGKLNSLLKRMGVDAHEREQELSTERLESEANTVRVQAIKRSPVDPVGQIVEINGQKLAMIDLGQTISRDFRVTMNDNILSHGEPFGSGGALGKAAFAGFGAGSTMATSLLAGNVFLATASPTTLMPIGAGIGSAVMGPTGIISQAPFIAAGSAIMPVVAPVMLFMTVFGIMMLARFERVQDSLNTLAETISEILKRDVAEDYGLVLSANERLRDIREEFEESRRFTDEMKIRLALVERDLSSVHHKYGIIAGGRISGKIATQMAPTDQHIFAMSAVANINVDRLRLMLGLQDNPDDIRRSSEALVHKVNEYVTDFKPSGK